MELFLSIAHFSLQDFLYDLWQKLVYNTVHIYNITMIRRLSSLEKLIYSHKCKITTTNFYFQHEIQKNPLLFKNNYHFSDEKKDKKKPDEGYSIFDAHRSLNRLFRKLS